MLHSSLAPYLLWAKTRQPAPIDLAGSNLLHCTMDDLPGAREALALSAPNDNGYAPVVTAIARHYGVDPSRVSQAGGCSGANFIAMAALVGAGDHVLVERPTYDPLLGAAQLMGATLVRFERRASDGFRVNLDDVRRALTPKTRLIVVTSPHNPSGVKIDRATLEGLSALAASRGAHVLVDEVYLDGACLASGEDATSQSAAHVDGPVVVTSSLTKSYGLAGLRSGWSVATPETAERMRRTRDLIDNANSAPADRIAALAWTLQPQLAERTRALLRANLSLARDFFAAHPEFELPEPPSCSVVFPRLAGQTDAEAFVRYMLDTHGLALAPGRFFESPSHFRVSLAGPTPMLQQGLSKLGDVSVFHRFSTDRGHISPGRS